MVRFRPSHLTASSRLALSDAQDLADRNGAPVEVWERDGMFALSELPEDDYDVTPTALGWKSYALVEPQEEN